MYNKNHSDIYRHIQAHSGISKNYSGIFSHNQNPVLLGIFHEAVNVTVSVNSFIHI